MKAIPLLCLLGLICTCKAFAQTPVSPVLADAISARQLLGEAKVLFDSNKFEQGGELAERAYAFFQSAPGTAPVDLAEAAYQSGRSVYKKGEYAKSQKRFEIASKVWDQLYPNEVRTADAFHNIARCLYWRDKQDSALIICARAYKIRQALQPESPCDLTESQRYMGNIILELGRYRNAILYYDSALIYQVICSGPESEGVADVLGNLGYAWSLQGDLQKSIAFQEQSLSIRQKVLPPGHLDLAYSLHNLGFAYKTLLKYTEALEYFERGLEIRLKNLGETHLEVANSYSEIGRTYLGMRDYQKALENFEKCHAVMVKLKATQTGTYSYVCSNMGQINLALKNYPAAVEWHTKTVAFRRAANKSPNSPLASALVQLGYARLANNEFEEAKLSFQEAEQIWTDLFGQGDPILSKAHVGMANCYRRRYLKTAQADQLEQSRTYFDLARGGIEKMLKHETSVDAQKRVLSEAVPVFDKAIEAEILYMNSGPENPVPLEKAWQLSEAMHSYLLFASTQEAKARHFAGIPDAELNRDSVLRAQITSLEKKRRSLIESHGLGLADSLVISVSIEISAKKDEAQQLQAFFEKHYPDYFRLKYQLESSSLQKTQQLLTPQQTLLEYFTGDTSIFVFIVQQKGSRVVALQRDFPLSDWVQQFREGISGYHAASQKTLGLYQKTVQQYADAAQKLYEKLLAPIAAFLTPEIIVVPGDGFANLPFEALLSAAPKDLSNFNTYPFLLRNHSFQYAYSATMLHQMMGRQHKQPPVGDLLAFAPFYEEDTTSLALRLSQEDAVRLGFSALPFSGEEIFRAKKRWGSSSALMTGQKATKQKFQALAAQYKILHLATHGKANHLSGDFSFLAFASEDENQENGLLSVGELYNLPLNADLVILSACETGIGEQQRGEGVVSLARAFAFAGAKSIVASLWSVNDKSTMQVMDNFYAGLKSGNPKNLALSNAKLQYMAKNPAQKAHPFFWAGFVAVGDMGAIKN